MASKPRPNPTPTWPLDLERVVRSAGFRSKGSNRRVEVMALGVAAKQLGLDLTVWLRTLRYSSHGIEKAVDALVLYHGHEMASIEMDRDWNTVANRLLRRVRGATQEEKNAAYWTCGAQALELDNMALQQQWFLDMVERARLAMEEALTRGIQERLDDHTAPAPATALRMGRRL